MGQTKRMLEAKHNGNHGSPGQAIDYAIKLEDDGESGMTFLRQWIYGNTIDEWPDFYKWLDDQEGKLI